MKETCTPTPRITIARIAVPKPQQVLAEHLRESILRGEIPEGETLPSERDLVSQTGLSRGAVREALRTLAVEGLVQTKHGRFGGSVVTLPGNESMASAINRFVKGRRLPLRTLQETREALEPFLARQAAERRTDDQLAELQAIHSELVSSAGDFEEFATINVKWHNAVARASGNELLAALLYSISHGVHIATSLKEYDTPGTREQVIRIHGRINDAIAARNPELAERGMRQHMVATHKRPLVHEKASIPLSDEEAPPKPPARRSAKS